MDNYIVSARKYRPATFDTVVGQRALTTTLKNAIANNKLAHAYLFCGPRGVGKTTCARIFAKTINCLSPTAEGEACNHCESCMAFNEQRSYNIHELDAASNNSVEDIRALIDQVRIPPQIGRYKVYIIDEVHMLSTAAFNAFLKTLEEPPHHAIFILATTEKHKILPTILSRCQIYDFSRISVTDTIEHLQYVAQKEGIDVEPEALTVIAQKADGGMRDALSIFDQVTSFCNGHITYKSVIENLNVLDYEYYFKLTDLFLENKVSESMIIFNEILKKGFDANHFITGLGSHFRDLLVSHDEITLQLLEVGASIRERYKTQAKKCEPKFLYKAMKLCNDCDLNYRQSKNKRLLVEITLIQLAQLTSESDDSGNGRSPKQTLKPIFSTNATNGQAVATSNNSVQNIQNQNAQNQNIQANPYTQNNVPNNVAGSTVQSLQPQNGNQVNNSPNNNGQPAQSVSLPGLKVDSEKKIPVVKSDSLGISIKKKVQHQEQTGSAVSSVSGMNASAGTAFPTSAAQAVDSTWEDYDVYDKDIVYYWRAFATNLPKEEAANKGRMMSITPKLLENDTTFEVVVDNDMVQNDMMKLSPQIEAYLREQLHNRKIKMTVRISAANENIKAFSHVERFQMMSKKNPSLLKLKEVLGLELS